MPVALLTLPAVSPTGFLFACSGLWRIFRIALQDSGFAFHSSCIVTYAQVQRWRHSRTGVFFLLNSSCIPTGRGFSVFPENTPDHRRLGCIGSICSLHVSPAGLSLVLQVKSYISTCGSESKETHAWGLINRKFIECTVWAIIWTGSVSDISFPGSRSKSHLKKDLMSSVQSSNAKNTYPIIWYFELPVRSGYVVHEWSLGFAKIILREIRAFTFFQTRKRCWAVKWYPSHWLRVGKR